MPLTRSEALPAGSRANDDRLGLWVAAGVSLLYLVLSVGFTRYRQVFEMDPDEGNNLVKALLLDRGYHYVTEIWSDQPPLFSYLLWGAFRIFGWKVAVAREFVLATSAALVFGIYDSVRLTLNARNDRLASHFGASSSVAFLMLASGFASLRVSAMIGMPSITCAVLSFWALLRSNASHDQRRIWELAAGIFFGLSLCFKLFTAFLLPVVGLVLIGGVSRKGPKDWFTRLRATAIWFAFPFAATITLGMLPCLRSGAYTQLFATHASAWGEYKSSATVLEFLRNDSFLFGCAAMGVLFGLKQKLWSILPFAGWLLSGLTVLRLHNPIWAHHNQLIVVPAAYLAGIFVVLAPEFIRQRASRGLHILSLSLALSTLLVTRGQRMVLLLSPSTKDPSRDEGALHAIEALGIRRGMMVTSRQIYAFYLGLTVPPQLSVTSAKRFRTGQLDADMLIRQVDESRPELILLSKRWRPSVRNQLMAAVTHAYDVVYEDPDNQQLVVLRRRQSLE